MKAAGMDVPSGEGKKPVYGKKKGSSDEDKGEAEEARKEAEAEEVPHISVMEVRQGGKLSVRGTDSGQRTRGSANSSSRQGQGGQASGDGSGDGFTPARNTPLKNGINYALGKPCQSTIWNETDRVVHVIITDTKTKKITNTNRNVEVKPTVASFSVGQAGIASTTSAEEVPTLTISPIPSRQNQTFNLNGSDYFLTFYTVTAESVRIVHQLNIRVKGKNDYVIKQQYLENRVELSDGDYTLGVAIFGPGWTPRTG